MANDLENRIREEAKRLLESGEVTVVIGWEAGSAPFKTTPAFIENAADVERLVWNPACTNNLAVYLPQVASFDKLRMAKVGIIAKPCDSRSIVTLIQEKQVPRENVVIIGVTCQGITDDAALKKANVRLSDIRGLDWDGQNVQVTTADGQTSVPLADAVKEGCRTCETRTPVIADVTIGNLESGPQPPAPGPDPAFRHPELVEGPHSAFAERRAYWARQFERCIRCYACRQVCPSCYCAKCFADRTDAKWTSKRAVTSEAWMFHMGRAMHLAGRCIGCGECERACPMELPIMKLNREVGRHVQNLFDFTPGMDPEEPQVLGSFDPEDKDPNH